MGDFSLGLRLELCSGFFSLQRMAAKRSAFATSDQSTESSGWLDLAEAVVPWLRFAAVYLVAATSPAFQNSALQRMSGWSAGSSDQRGGYRDPHSNIDEAAHAWLQQTSMWIECKDRNLTIVEAKADWALSADPSAVIFLQMPALLLAAVGELKQVYLDVPSGPFFGFNRDGA